MSAMETNQYELSDPPHDGITRVKFFNNSDHLIVTSWDKSVVLYDITKNNDYSTNTPRIHTYYHSAGVLDCCLTKDDSTIFSVGCDYNLISFDCKKSKQTIIGSHSQPIRCVEYCNELNLIITGSWDKSIKLWDQRQPNQNQNQNNDKRFELPGKVFAMNCGSNSYNLILGISGRIIWIYDLRNMSVIKKESSLKHQTRSIVTHPNNEQYVVSSIEGRVAVEYFNPSSDQQTKKYAFKCHRITDKISGIQTIYPVNAIAFHPIHKTFATGGGDGVVNIWDGNNKKRICQFSAYQTSIASLDFNKDGSLMSIASSYTWEQGEIPKPKDTVWIKKIKTNEVKPKPKK